jgi:hypothetical protein
VLCCVVLLRPSQIGTKIKIMDFAEKHMHDWKGKESSIVFQLIFKSNEAELALTTYSSRYFLNTQLQDIAKDSALVQQYVKYRNLHIRLQV